MLRRFNSWLAAPFVTPLNPETTFIVVGVVLVSAIAWGIILRHVTAGIEAAV